MFDTVIRGAQIVDGNGAAPFSGDIAIQDGLIQAVGTVAGRGREEIQADGAVATPGWVDVHTHYDGQVSWDDTLDPSFSHGVTSVVMGNCGVGFAPAPPGGEQRLIELMEGVEDIPGTALYEGIEWGALGDLPGVFRLYCLAAVHLRCWHPSPAQCAAELCDGGSRSST